MTIFDRICIDQNCRTLLNIPETKQNRCLWMKPHPVLLPLHALNIPKFNMETGTSKDPQRWLFPYFNFGKGYCVVGCQEAFSTTPMFYMFCQIPAAVITSWKLWRSKNQSICICCSCCLKFRDDLDIAREPGRGPWISVARCRHVPWLFGHKNVPLKAPFFIGMFQWFPMLFIMFEFSYICHMNQNIIETWKVTAPKDKIEAKKNAFLRAMSIRKIIYQIFQPLFQLGSAKSRWGIWITTSSCEIWDTIHGHQLPRA